MSFERSFFFGCVQKDLEDSSLEEQLAVFSFDDAMCKTETVDGSTPRTTRWSAQVLRTRGGMTGSNYLTKRDPEFLASPQTIIPQSGTGQHFPSDQVFGHYENSVITSRCICVSRSRHRSSAMLFNASLPPDVPAETGPGMESSGTRFPELKSGLRNATLLGNHCYRKRKIMTDSAARGS